MPASMDFKLALPAELNSYAITIMLVRTTSIVSNPFTKQIQSFEFAILTPYKVGDASKVLGLKIGDFVLGAHYT